MMRGMKTRLYKMIPAALAFALAAPGCAGSPPPRNVNDACAILHDRPDWIEAAYEAERKWGAPAPTILAFIWKESRFQASARPPRKHVLGMIPNGRVSSSYGYSQAIDGTWDWYREDSGNSGADRDDFEDSADFIGWYMDKTRRKTGAPMTDAAAHYLAYNLGHGGYKSGKWRNSPAAIRRARETAQRGAAYAAQLRRCDSRYAMISQPGGYRPL